MDSLQNRVLLVEDYAANVLITTIYLDELGYSYDVASYGEEALALVKRHNYHAILMDVQMHGMNGYETTRHIRNHERDMGKPRCLIIGVTAHAASSDREQCFAAGMDEYITKPISIELLREKLNRNVKTAA